MKNKFVCINLTNLKQNKKVKMKMIKILKSKT